MVDRDKREVNVFQRTRTPPVPRKGNIVVGEVQQVQDKMATLRLFKVGRSELKKPFTAIVHVSLATQGFLRSIYDAFKPGDLVRAQVVGDENQPFQLTTVGRELGVIQASCSRCGKPLLLNRKQLICPQCRAVEKRKISEKYGEL
jgi:exosome complex component CSL4